jgi:type I restriction enzyme, S subunit
MSKWPLVQLGEVLTPVSRPENVRSDVTYRVLGAHWYAEGLYTKETKFGSEIQATKVYRVEEGDFVYNRLFAWKGSFAIATGSNHGCYVSNEFPCFTVKPGRADGQYLWRHFSRISAWEEALGLSTGGTPTSRNRLKEEKLLAMAIPLPPLSGRQWIVARLEALSAKIKEARRLQKEVIAGLDNLCRSMIFNQSFASSTKTPMRDLVRLREPDVVVRSEELYGFAGVYCFGGGVFKGQQKSGMEFAYPRLTQLKTANFVYPKLMAWEGALGIVPADCDGLVVSTEFPVFEVDESRVYPEVLDVYFRTPSVWPALAGVSTGTNVRRRRLNPSDFLNYQMPLPPLPVQQKLRQVKSRADSIKKLQAETAAELAALMPSILDKAFNGEL